MRGIGISRGSLHSFITRGLRGGEHAAAHERAVLSIRPDATRSAGMASGSKQPHRTCSSHITCGSPNVGQRAGDWFFSACFRASDDDDPAADVSVWLYRLAELA
jgi:hypothetical protein